MRAAVVETSSNVVLNIIVGSASEVTPPKGCFLVDATDTWCDIGALYDASTNTFKKYEPQEPAA